MNDETRKRALRLEEMLPRLMRTIYRVQESDPMQSLPVAQVRVLRILFGGPKSHSAVSDELGISVSAVTQVANRLEALGLVHRVESSLDRRVKHLKLTSYGLKCMKERQEYRVTRTIDALAHVSEETQEKLLDILQEIIDTMHQVEADKKPNLATDLAQMGSFPLLGGETRA